MSWRTQIGIGFTEPPARRRSSGALDFAACSYLRSDVLWVTEKSGFIFMSKVHSELTSEAEVGGNSGPASTSSSTSEPAEVF